MYASGSQSSLQERKLAKLRKIDSQAELEHDAILKGIAKTIAGSPSKPRFMAPLAAAPTMRSVTSFGSLPPPSDTGRDVSLIPKNRFGQPLPQQQVLGMPKMSDGARRGGQKLHDHANMKYKSLSQAFRHIDADRSNKLDMEEVLKATLAWNLHLSANDVEELIDGCDENGDGKIDYGEFSRGLGRLMESQHKTPFGLNDSKVTDGYAKFGNRVMINDNLFHASQSALHQKPMALPHTLPAGQAKGTPKELHSAIGQLSNKLDEKYKKYQMAFRKLDQDKSGCLDKDEMIEAVQNLTLPIPITHVEQIFNSLADKNGDGRIDYSEFCQLMMQKDLKEVEALLGQ